MAFFTRILALSGIVALALAADRTACGEDPKQPEPPTPAVKNRKTDTPFVFPCDDYMKGLKGKGNFGILIGKSQSSAFGGTYHLAEDVCFKAARRSGPSRTASWCTPIFPKRGPTTRVESTGTSGT